MFTGAPRLIVAYSRSDSISDNDRYELISDLGSRTATC
jgi:hypothetical protein